MTAFDAAVRSIEQAGYHNHRLEEHSDTVSSVFFADLLVTCEPLKRDYEREKVRFWLNVKSPGDRRRKADLFVGEPGADGQPDIQKVRIVLENKSVITAHRNRTNRFDDLHKVLGAIHAARPEALILGTVLIGLADRVLNVPDQVHPMYLRTGRDEEFHQNVLPRLSSGDQSLWDEFNYAISRNRPHDPARTLELLRTLPTRKPGHTHIEGFDYLLGVPVLIDNVNPPTIPRPNPLGVDVDAEYKQMLEQVCAAYTARWHM